MAGLYGDLPQAKQAGSDAAPSWGATPKLQPQPRKPTILAPPPSLLRSGGRGGRTPGGRGPGRGSAATATGGTDTVTESATSTPAALSIFATVQDEYDPMRPNDYEDVLRERERNKQEAIAEAERLAKVKEMEAAMEKLRQQEEGPSAAEALNVSGEDAYLRRGQRPAPGALGATQGLGAPGGAQATEEGLQGPGAGAGGEAKGMTLAQKMLMKMGWREGEGLGRDRQGMSTPLVMQKTNARAGVIVNADPTGAAAEKKKAGAVIVGTPSRVLCLRNMVGPGEVDEELEEEVGVECTKYGTVTSVMIFEITQPGYPPEEAVRIFVQFDRNESAMKALVDLQGRFFAGRTLRGAFFSEDRFAKLELAPVAGEFDA